MFSLVSVNDDVYMKTKKDKRYPIPLNYFDNNKTLEKINYSNLNSKNSLNIKNSNKEIIKICDENNLKYSRYQKDLKLNLVDYWDSQIWNSSATNNSTTLINWKKRNEYMNKFNDKNINMINSILEDMKELSP